MSLKRYGLIRPLVELGREAALRCKSRVGTLCSQSGIEVESCVRLASTVRVRGGGRVILRRGAVIDSGARFFAEESSVIDIGPCVRVGAGTQLRTLAGQQLVVGAETVIETDVLITSTGGVAIASAALIGARTIIASREPGGGGHFQMGRGSHLSVDNLVDTCSDVAIGDDVRTGPGCAFYTHKHVPTREGLIWDQPITTAPITVGNAAWIGHGCQVMPGAHVGESAVVGAGSIVTKPVPQGVIAVGVPARVLREV